MKKIIMVLCATLATGTAGAQSAWWDSCTDSTQSATYSRCGLLLMDGQLMRGRPRELVTMGESLSPIALGRYVRGEPARRYALKYERESRTGLVLRFVGGTVLLGESLAIVTGRVCVETAEGKVNRTATGLMAGGLGLVVSSVPFRWLAWRDGERAVAAHNAALVRE